jgi:hypothetical protein
MKKLLLSISILLAVVITATSAEYDALYFHLGKQGECYNCSGFANDFMVALNWDRMHGEFYCLKVLDQWPYCMSFLSSNSEELRRNPPRRLNEAIRGSSGLFDIAKIRADYMVENGLYAHDIAMQSREMQKVRLQGNKMIREATELIGYIDPSSDIGPYGAYVAFLNDNGVPDRGHRVALAYEDWKYIGVYISTKTWSSGPVKGCRAVVVYLANPMEG